MMHGDSPYSYSSCATSRSDSPLTRRHSRCRRYRPSHGFLLPPFCFRFPFFVPAVPFRSVIPYDPDEPQNETKGGGEVLRDASQVDHQQEEDEDEEDEPFDITDVRAPRHMAHTGTWRARARVCACRMWVGRCLGDGQGMSRPTARYLRALEITGVGQTVSFCADRFRRGCSAVHTTWRFSPWWQWCG